MLDRKIRYCSLPEAIRDHFLWGARSIVIAGTHGKTTTTSLTGWLLTHGGARSERARRRHRAQLRRRRIELPPRQRPRLRHRGRRVRQRVLRQDREVPEVPARHRRRQQRRVRPRRHLRRPRRRDAGVPAARQSGAAARAAAGRRRQSGGARALHGSAVSRVETFGLATTSTGRRTTSTPAGDGDRASACAATGRRSASSRCRCSARTTSATRWRRSPSRPTSASAPERIAEGLRDVRRRQAAARSRRHGRRRDGLRRLRASSDGGRRNAGRPARVASGRAHLGGVRAALGVVVPPRLPGRLRARVRAAPTKC